MVVISEATTNRPGPDQGNSGKFLGIGIEEYKSALLKGHGFFREGRLNEARKLFEEMAALDSRNPYIHEMLGAIYQKAGNEEAAIYHYGLAILLFPRNIESLCIRGELLLKAGRMKEAEMHFKCALDLDPDRKHPLANRARLLKTLSAEAIPVHEKTQVLRKASM